MMIAIFMRTMMMMVIIIVIMIVIIIVIKIFIIVIVIVIIPSQLENWGQSENKRESGRRGIEFDYGYSYDRSS